LEPSRSILLENPLHKSPRRKRESCYGVKPDGIIMAEDYTKNAPLSRPFLMAFLTRISSPPDATDHATAKNHPEIPVLLSGIYRNRNTKVKAQKNPVRGPR
jgi:hypothetical protein